MEALENKETLEQYLELDIDDDDLILSLIDGETPIVDVVDLQGILNFLRDWNREYCESHNLCPVCRARLVDVEDLVPYGDYMVPMVDECCPNGCL